MKDCNYYTLWFNMGQYDVLQIERHFRIRAMGRDCNGVSKIVNLRHCHGKFNDKATADQAARCVAKIHNLHRTGIRQALTTYNSLVRMRDYNIMEFLNGLRSS